MTITPILRLNRLSPFAIVLLLSIAFGSLPGLLGHIVFSDAIDHGQVLAGKVVYPVSHPIGLYFSRAYSLANHLSGLWLKVGLPESTLACLLQALKGVLLFAGLALCTFALTARVTWSVLSPIVWYTFGLWHFTDSYPITSIIHGNTNGFLGLAWLVLTLGLMANCRRLAGGFALGILPYVHPAFGVFGWLLGALWYTLNRPKPMPLAGFVAGAMVFAGSFALHNHMFVYQSSVNPALAEYYYYFYTLLFDYHRQPLHVTSVHTLILLLICSLAVLYLSLNRTFAHRNDAAVIPIAAISAVAIAFSYSAIGSTAGLMAMPRIVLTIMPGRLANLALLLSGPLLFGLASYLPSRVATIFAIVLTASAFVPRAVTDLGLDSYGWNEPVSVLIWFLALSVSLLLANYGVPAGEFTLRRAILQIRPTRAYVLRVIAASLLTLLAFGVIRVFTATTWFSTTLTLKTQHFVGFILLLAAFFALMSVPAWRRKTMNTVSRPPLLVLVGSLVAGSLVFALNADLLLEPTVVSSSIARTKAGKISNIPPGQIIPATDDVEMQLQSGRIVLWFFDARTILSYVPEAGPALERLLNEVYGWHQLYDPSTWGISLKNTWGKFGRADWQRIASRYGAGTVVAPCDFRLAIPLARRSGSNCFYYLPNIDSLPPGGTIPAFNTLDYKAARYFFFPHAAWNSQGWYSLEADSTLTSTWAWLEKVGQIGVFVPREGDYHLRAIVSSVGDQRVSIGLHGASTTTPFHLLSVRKCPGNSDFRFDALHLNAGFNVIDVKSEGQLADIGSGRMASIAFKNIRWESAEEVAFARDRLGVGHCSPVIPFDAMEMSSDSILGIWIYQGKPAKIAAADSTGTIVCTNEINASVKVTINDGKFLLAPDWNAYATLSRNGKELKWSNGSVWTR